MSEAAGAAGQPAGLAGSRGRRARLALRAALAGSAVRFAGPRGRRGAPGQGEPGLSGRLALINPLAGIDVAKSRGARYRLGPELEIW